ncbi:alpha/beta fold hydrolase [Fredinandcohnia sp. 179-A 10B2 NHS]|uniref:alpha/beta fold hydrolase n=1 Tax=Fredinandcohnia sp. 179-A 10B2 NHS TaxID=3235176 RepID=UPI0039A1252D
MRSKVVKSNNTEIFINEYGRQDGEPLFLLHPGGTNGYVWLKLIPFFELKYRVIVMDMRGHGQSMVAKSGYAMENQAKDIIGVMDYLNIKQAHLIGNSLGTDVAVHTAANFPERIKSLVNIDAGMLNFIGPNGEMEGTKEEWVNRSLNRKLLDFNSREEFSMFIKDNYSEWGEEYVELTSRNIPLRTLPNGKVTHMLPVEINALLMEAWCDMNFEDCYPKITCPVLFIPATAENKLSEKLAMIEIYKEYLPSVEVVLIENTSHIPLCSHSKELAVQINQFLEKVELLS